MSAEGYVCAHCGDETDLEVEVRADGGGKRATVRSVCHSCGFSEVIPS